MRLVDHEAVGRHTRGEARERVPSWQTLLKERAWDAVRELLVAELMTTRIALGGWPHRVTRDGVVEDVLTQVELFDRSDIYLTTGRQVSLVP